MFSTTIIPTVGRASLEKAVTSVLEQAFSREDFEVIVVNDSGIPLPEAAWQKSDKVRVITTYRRERAFARNTGAASAQGRYLHFLDDDDWLMPGALEALWQLTQTSGEAVWMYGGAELVDGPIRVELQLGINGNVYTQVMSGQWIPLQSSLIDAPTFFKMGGFDSATVPSEDVDLSRRMALKYPFAGTTAITANIDRSTHWQSTSSAKIYTLDQRLFNRDRLLELPGNFSRLLASAPSSYWRGRISRFYLTSLYWNLKKRRPWRVMERAVNLLTVTLLSLPHLISSQYWNGMLKEHSSGSE